MDQREWVDAVFRAHSGELYRYLRSFRLSEEVTYDLVQDSFVKLLDFDPSQIRQPCPMNKGFGPQGIVFSKAFYEML